MQFGSVDTTKKTFIVAEAGNNHEGNFGSAKELVIRAADAGVDAIKFQTFIPELLVSPINTERLRRLRSFQLSFAQFESLAQLACDNGIVFFSTPLDIESAHFLNSIQSVFKIASGDNDFLPLVDTILSFKKPVIVSTGISTFDQTDALYNLFNSRGQLSSLSFLHCVSSYPTPYAQGNLLAIRTLCDRYKDVTIGYSDHTMGTSAAIYSVAIGARIVEKHFTLSKERSSFRDHQLSADPDELKSLVSKIRELESLLGDGVKALQPSEMDLVVEARRSIAAATDIPAGHLITLGDLVWLRPALGFRPGSEALVVGKVTRKSVSRGHIFTQEDLVDSFDLRC